MPFLQLTIELGKRDPEPVEEALFAIGALSVTLEDAADDPILEPAPGALPLWPTVNIKALFDADSSRSALLEQLLHFLPDMPPHHFEDLADRPWEREWLKDFHAMRFGQRLWICPDGQRPDDLTDAVIVDLDPGLAFGTGTHPTTALCLQWLDGQSLQGKTVIDYGCGSGILAIAALKLGATQAFAVDIDPQALIASHDNAQRNGVAAQLVVSLQDTQLQPADIMMANILAGPLEALAPRLAALTRTHGQIVLSGVLTEQAQSVQNAYAAWFDMNPIVYQGDWARLSGTKT